VIHFWLHDPPPAAELAGWDPDLEPRRFASGVGHNVLELAKRLELLGVPVSVGRKVPGDARLLVLYLVDSLQTAAALRGALRAAQEARGRFAVIRSDAPSSWAFPVRPVREFAPTRTSIVKPWQRWVPPLPQRGLLPRRPERQGRIHCLTFKGNPENVPSELLSRAWSDSLASRGIRWWLDTPARTDGSDQCWHDFTEVDAALCMRHPLRARDAARKPATRLTNTWVAGCVPFAAREPGYLELGRDGRDVFFVDTPWQCLELLDDLNADAARLSAVEREIDRRGEEYALEKTAQRWREAIFEAVSAADRARVSARASRMLAILEKRFAHVAHETIHNSGGHGSSGAALPG
jgi:hypothetical protein